MPVRVLRVIRKRGVIIKISVRVCLCVRVPARARANRNSAPKEVRRFSVGAS